VPRSILYDNTTLAVARILGGGVRQRTRVYSELQSHYVFEDRFGRPGKGNDKGKVEGLIGWIRRNLLVPVPRAVSLMALNEQLLEGCRRRLGDRLRSHDETIGERLFRDLEAFHPLPPAPYVQISAFPTGDFGSNRQAVSVETDRPFRSKAAPRCEWVLVPALANRRCVIHPILLWPVKASTLVIIIVSSDCCGRLWIALIVWISVVNYLFD
jgi:hypothetical protein